METSINLRLNAGQAKSEAEAVRQSLENLAGSAERLKGEGGWGGAAEAIRKQQEAQFQSLQQQTAGYPAGGSAAGGARHVGSGSAEQAIKSLEMRIEALTRVSEDLAQQLEKAAEGGDAQASFNLSSTLNNVEQERRELEKEKQKLLNPPGDNNNNGKGGLEGALKAFNINQLLGYAVSISGINASYQQAMARGDYIGAEVGKKSGTGSMLMGAGGTVAGLGALAGGPLGIAIGAIVGGILSIVGAVQKIDADRLATIDANADAFSAYFNPASQLGRRFNNDYWVRDPSNPDKWIKNPKEDPDKTSGLPEYVKKRHGFYDNNEFNVSLMEEAIKKADGLEIDPTALLDLAASQSAHGVKSASAALDQARQAASFAQSTGAGMDAAASYIGLVSRFGAGSLSDVTRGRNATGMTVGQSDEFLAGLQRVIEEGIASGFVRSSEDVAKTMTMFYRLSDENPLWQGKYGAANLSKMNAGVAGATALSSSSDVMAYGAAQEVLKKIADNPDKAKEFGLTGTYIDAMRVLEEGVSVDLFYAVADEISKMEGGNIAAQVERFRQIFGVGYEQGYQLYEMAQKGGEITQEDIDKAYKKESGKDAEYNSYNNIKQSLETTLGGKIALAGEDDYWQKLGKLFEQTNEEIKNVGPSVGDRVSGWFETLKGFLPESVQQAFDKGRQILEAADEEGARLEFEQWNSGRSSISGNFYTMKRSAEGFEAALANVNGGGKTPSIGGLASALGLSLFTKEVAGAGADEFLAEMQNYFLKPEYYRSTDALKAQGDAMGEVVYQIIQGAAAHSPSGKRDVLPEEIAAVFRQLVGTDIYKQTTLGNTAEAVKIIKEAIREALGVVVVETAGNS